MVLLKFVFAAKTDITELSPFGIHGEIFDKDCYDLQK